MYAVKLYDKSKIRWLITLTLFIGIHLRCFGQAMEQVQYKQIDTTILNMDIYYPSDYKAKSRYAGIGILLWWWMEK